MMWRLAVAFCVAAAGGGCQTSGRSMGPAEHALGTSVPDNYRELVAAHFREGLKDPYSVRDVGISAPRQEFVGIFNGGMRDAVCVRLNAKNSFGAYIGVRRHVVIFNGGRVAASGDNPFACQADVEFLPFPQMEGDVLGGNQRAADAASDKRGKAR